MARSTWRRVIGTVVQEWTQSSLMLDPMAYAAALQATGPDAFEDHAVDTHRAAAKTRRMAPSRTGTIRLDVLAG